MHRVGYLPIVMKRDQWAKRIICLGSRIMLSVIYGERTWRVKRWNNTRNQTLQSGICHLDVKGVRCRRCYKFRLSGCTGEEHAYVMSFCFVSSHLLSNFFRYWGNVSGTSIVKKALEQLYSLNALDNSGKITSLGKRMAKFPLEPTFAKVLLASEVNCYIHVTWWL